MILHIEGARPLAGSLSILRTFYRLGLRIMGFAWSWRNEVADGTAEKNSSGLSHFGVELVREMNRLKILIDLSHISDACFYHVLNVSEAPVIATHSNARALHNHPRNLSDDMIRKLAEKGGVMGLCFFPHFVSSKENVTVDDIVDHVDYIKKLVGIDHVALGPDFLDYRIWAFKDVIGSFASVQEGGAQTSKDLESYFRYPEGVENVTKLPNFTKAMLRRGYSEEDIIKVLGNNLIRIYKQVWK
jgi:membrane dipeptidase